MTACAAGTREHVIDRGDGDLLIRAELCHCNYKPRARKRCLNCDGLGLSCWPVEWRPYEPCARDLLDDLMSALAEAPDAVTPVEPVELSQALVDALLEDAP